MVEFDSGRRFVLKSVVGGMVFGVGTGSGAAADGNEGEATTALQEDPQNLVAAISTDEVAEAITGVEFRGEDEQVGVVEQELQGFPLEDGSYAVLSSGFAADAPGDPETFVDTNAGGREFDNYSPDDFDAFDVAEIRIDIAVPEGAEGIAFDYKFGSDENPTFLNSNYQDFFEANLVRPNVGPTNIGLLPDGSPVTVDNANEFSNSPGGGSQNPSSPLPDPADVTYNAVTDLLTANASLVGSGGDTVRLILRIGDASDEYYDSAVFLDNLRFVGDVEVSPVLVENALADYESTVRWGIEQYVQALADRDARLYDEYGEAYAEDLVEYFGYLAGEVSADALDEEWLDEVEATAGDVTADRAVELYEFFDGLFESWDFFDYYWNEYPLRGSEGDAVRTFSELDSAYETAFAERADAFLEALESGDFSGGEVDAIVGYLNARAAEFARATKAVVDDLEDRTEALLANDGAVGGRLDALSVPAGEAETPVRTGAYLLVNAETGTAALGAIPPASRSGTWVSGQPGSHDATVQFGTWAETGSALQAPSAVSSFFAAVEHATASRALRAGHAIEHAWEVTESDAGFVADVVDDAREQTAALAASGPADAVEIAGQDAEIVDLAVEDVTIDAAIESEAGFVGEGTGTITIENTGSGAFAPVPTGTIVANTVLVDAQSHSTGYPVVLDEEAPEIEPGETATVEFRYAVPINLLPTTYTLVASVVGHDGTASATFTAGVSEPEGVETETVASGELTDGASEETTHEPADGTAILSYKLEYSQLDADLHLYDEFDNHTGVDSATEELENQIPNATHSGPDEGVSGTESITVKDPASSEYTIEVHAPDIETIVQNDDVDAASGANPSVASASSPGVGSATGRTLPNLNAVGTGVNVEYAVDSTQVPELPPTLSVSLDQAPPVVEGGDEVSVSMRVSETGTNAAADGLTASVGALTGEHGDDSIEDVSVADGEFSLDPGASRTFAVDVAVPEDVQPDVYSGTVSVSDADGNVDAEGTVRVAFADVEAEDDPEGESDPESTDSSDGTDDPDDDDDGIPGFGPIVGAASVAGGAYAAKRLRAQRDAGDGEE